MRVKSFHNFKPISLLILILIGSISLSVNAQEIKLVNELSNEVNIPTDIQQELAGSSDPLESILLRWYAYQGYLNATIESLEDNYFQVNRRCRFKINSIEISEPLDIINNQIEYGFYSMDFLSNELDLMIKAYEEEGYPFASIFIDEFNVDEEECEVSIRATLKAGKQYRTTKILFTGAKSNNASYLRTISGYRDSLLITGSLLDQFRSRLVNSELFELVSNPEVFLENDAAVIVIAVQERVLNQFDGLLGYVPDQNGEGQIVGDFELSLWNVLEQGNGFDLKYRRLRPETSRLYVGASQDWFGGIPIGVGANFNFYQNDTTYQTRQLNLDAYYIAKRGLRLIGGLGQIASTSNSSTNEIREPDGKKRYAELGFSYSTLDNLDNPTSGIRIKASFGVTNKSVEIDSIKAFSQQYIRSEASYFLALSVKSVIAISMHSYFLNADKITEQDLTWFGGANSLRGYSEEQFRASRMLWSDIEYRFLVNRASYLFLFGAVGTYHRPQLLTEANNQFKTTDLLYSTGFGLSYKIKIGRLSFSYAISPDESLGNGKVHLGIVTQL